MSSGLCGQRGRQKLCRYDRYLTVDQVCRQRRKLIVFAVCSAIFDANIRAITDAAFDQSFPEGSRQWRRRKRPLVQETDNRSPLLCVCFSQKGGTAKRGQEVASPHVPLPTEEASRCRLQASTLRSAGYVLKGRN